MKKTPEMIHNNHAKQKAARGKERERAGYKPHKGISIGSSKKQENPLSNPITGNFIAQLRQLRAKEMTGKTRKREYKPRKV